VAYGIDIIPDVHVRTPFAERVLGNDEVVIIGGWRNQFRGTLVGAPGIQSFRDLRGKRVGDWYKGGIATLWYEHQLRKAGVDPDREIQWKIGYKFGSMREAYKPLLAGDTDAAATVASACSGCGVRGHLADHPVEAALLPALRLALRLRPARAVSLP